MNTTDLMWIWVAVFVAWWPTRKKIWIYFVMRLLFLVLGFIAGMIAMSSMIPLANQWLWLIGIKGSLIMIEVIFAYGIDANHFDNTDKLISGISGVIGIFLLFGSLFAGLYYQNAPGINNARYFDSLLTKMPEDSIPFNMSMPDNLTRLATSELVVSIAKNYTGEFEYNVTIMDPHITMYEKRLVWICPIAPENKSSIIGLVIVDANDPERRVTVLDKVTFKLGENLDGDGNIAKHAWNTGDVAYSYGRAYITQDDIGAWNIVLTTYYIEPWSFVNKFRGVDIYNTEGTFLGHSDPGNTPVWISQPYDEQTWLEGHIKNWGYFREDESIDDQSSAKTKVKVEMSEDTRYIYDPEIDDVAAIVLVNPKEQKDVLAGMFKVTRNGIYWYNMLSFNLVSASKTLGTINSRLYTKQNKGYFATMPLLYYIDGKPVWYTPIYQRILRYNEETRKNETISINIKGLGIVDATNENKTTIVFMEEGMNGEELVRKTRLSYLGQVFEKSLEQRKRDVIEFLDENGITLIRPESIYPDIVFNEGTCNYTSTAEWDSTQSFLHDFWSRHNQTEMIVQEEKEAFIKLGFWKYNETNKRSELYYVTIYFQNEPI